MATTANMALTLPVVSSTIGPTWATMVNAAFESIDSHDHTSGKGVKIPTSGLNINADLPFSNYLATGLKGAQFNSQASALTTLNCVHVAGGNLWFTNASGAQVQITSGGSVNAGSTGNILGLSSPAQAAYVLGTTQFSWYSNTAANQLASMRQAESVYHASGLTTNNSITVKPPATVGASYTLTLPAAVPTARGFLVSATSGAQEYSYVDNATIEDSSGIIGVKNLGITTAKIAAGGGANGTTGVTPDKLSPIFKYTVVPGGSGYVSNTSFVEQGRIANTQGLNLKPGVFTFTVQPSANIIGWGDWWIDPSKPAGTFFIRVTVYDNGNTTPTPKLQYIWTGGYLPGEKINWVHTIQDEWGASFVNPAVFVLDTKIDNASAAYYRGAFTMAVTQGG